MIAIFDVYRRPPLDRTRKSIDYDRNAEGHRLKLIKLQHSTAMRHVARRDPNFGLRSRVR